MAVELIMADPVLDVEAAPQPNLPLLRKVLDHIDAHPDEWDQGWWGSVTSKSSCGTAFCIAGHALVMSGYDAEPTRPGSYLLLFRDENGNEIDPESTAQRLLGITDDEADIFDAGNARKDVQFFADAIAARAGEQL